MNSMFSGSKKKKPRYTCLSASHSQRMWAEVSSSAPHLLHKGLLVNPIFLRILYSVRKPVATLDFVQLKGRCLVFGAGLRPEIISRACLWVLRGGADTSLARPTESIVSSERGVCSCAELQVFSCYRGRKEICQVTNAISTTSRRELSSSFFLQGKAPKEIHAILTETLGEHAPSYVTVKKLCGPG